MTLDDLRPFQRTAIANLRKSFASGKRAPLLVSPTGSGKTVMLGAIALGAVEKGGTVGVYAHRTELVDQLARTFRSFGLDVGANGINPSAPVQVMTVQTVLARGEVRPFSAVFFDECHHFASAAESWSTVVQAHKDSGSWFVGATATPCRGDGAALDHFDDIVIAATVKQLQAQGHLVRLDPEDIKSPRGTMRKGRVAQLPVDAYIAHGGGRRNIVFAPHVKAAREFADQFRARGVEARCVFGDTPADERADTLAALASGAVKVVINVYVLTEGFDCPAVEVVTLARPIGSIGMLMQTVGRGMRPAPGKTRMTLLDLWGACNMHGSPTQDFDYSLEGEGMTRKGIVGPRKCALCQRELAPEETVCSVCGREVPELETPTATGEALVPWQAKLESDPPDVRRARLARWIKGMIMQGKTGRSLFSARYRYAGTYGAPPDRETWDAAMFEARR
jgi:DNA repair protein RadD